MGIVVEGAFDRFRPRVPAKDKETELLIAADVDMLGKIAAWALARQQIVEHTGQPLDPRVRKLASDADNVLHKHPRAEPR